MNMKRTCHLLPALMLAIGVPAGALAQTASPAAVTIDRGLVFTRTPNKTLALDLYRPTNSAEKLPVVVLIYGGAWMMRFPQSQTRKAEWLAEDGYAAAVIDYRLSSEAKFPSQLYDCKAAVRWLRANAEKYDLNPALIGAWGDSSGGHLASLLGVTGGITNLEGDGGNPNESSRVQVVVDFFGPADLTRMNSHALPGSMIAYGTANSPEGMLIGGPVADHLETARLASPVNFATNSPPPFLIVHGDHDQLVPWQQSELLYEALKNAGADVTFYTIAGAGHEDPKFNSEMMCAAVKAFFDKNLKVKNSK
jgi:acetyl esterase/lipase